LVGSGLVSNNRLANASANECLIWTAGAATITTLGGVAIVEAATGTGTVGALMSQVIVPAAEPIVADIITAVVGLPVMTYVEVLVPLATAIAVRYPTIWSIVTNPQTWQPDWGAGIPADIGWLHDQFAKWWDEWHKHNWGGANESHKPL
jgi:hypothetical protein